ncbi:MAG: Lipopolysaccharide core heptosyltransferase RfaQ [Burkholderia gladioli]|nr:MAG: Lipopolysaccharide core heptosyltransferase RfaQ [Burkholderia gladioli]
MRRGCGAATISPSRRSARIGRVSYYTWFAGRRRVGLVDPNRVNLWTRFLLNRIAINDHQHEHTVVSTLALAPQIGIAPVPDVVAPGLGGDPAQRAKFDALLASSPVVAAGKPLVVLHPFPMFAYKQWRRDGWVELIGWLRSLGYAVALSGGPAQNERDYAEQVAREAGGDVLNLVGRLSFGENAELVRRAKLFVGPDTGATHVAAATTGTPVVALLGPSDPVRWGPWRKVGRVRATHGRWSARGGTRTCCCCCKGRGRACRAGRKAASAMSRATAIV